MVIEMLKIYFDKSHFSLVLGSGIAHQISTLLIMGPGETGPAMLQLSLLSGNYYLYCPLW